MHEPAGESHWQVLIYSKLYERKLWDYLLSNQMTNERKQEKVKHTKKFIQLIGWSVAQCLSNSKFYKSKIFNIIRLWTRKCVLFLNYPNIFKQNIFTCSCVLVLTIFVSLRKPNSYFIKIPANFILGILAQIFAPICSGRRISNLIFSLWFPLFLG